MNKFFVALIPLFSLFVVSCAYAEHLVTANDVAYLYTGRIDLAAEAGPFMSWPGSSVKANFSGKTLKVTLNDQQGKNYYNVILDGQNTHPYVLELKKGQHEYDLSHLLHGKATKTHSIELFKRTEGHEGGTHFIGLSLADGHKLLGKPQRPSRKIAFFGDSVTSGMGNEAPANGKDDRVAQKNHYLSYAAITARTLNAEMHTVSSSGIGFMVSWFDHIMPQVYDQLSGVGNNDTQWDFTKWQADVVVVNIGQNDSWLIDNEKRLQPPPTPADIVEHYVEFISSLRAHYPKATFICVLGSMNVSSKKHWVDYIDAAIANVKAQDKSSNIYRLNFDFTGYTEHPRVYQHVQNGQALSDKIRALMGW